MIKRFFRDYRRFFGYTNYSSVTILRSEVAYAYLNWLWWLLDPLLLMLVYTFISKYIFVSRPANYPLFVMTGITVWSFFNKSVMSSVTLISANRGLISKVYVPKFILVIIRMRVAFIKMLFSFAIVVGMLVVYKVPVTWRWLELIPILAMFHVVTFGVCCVCMHVGVFIHDLANVITVLLRVLMYLSGVFYSIQDVMPEPLNTTLLSVNPVALAIQCVRNIIQGQPVLNYDAVWMWMAAGCLLSCFGVFLVYKYENTYVKVL